jgi:hypothetical protein
MRRNSHLALVQLTVVFGFVLGSVAIAEAGTLSPEILRVEATNQLGSATFVVDSAEAEQHNDTWTWSLQSPVELLTTSNQLIATIDSASLSYVADPQVGLNFGVIAGSLDTMFTISSATLSFPALNPAEGRASAGISVTDGNRDGASLTGNIAAGKSYRASYNGGTVFADLVSDDSTGIAFGTFTSSDANPAIGFSPIAGSLTSMKTEFSFTIRAMDSAGGTSIFVTQIPEPSSLVLVLFGLVVLPIGLRNRFKA